MTINNPFLLLAVKAFFNEHFLAILNTYTNMHEKFLINSLALYVVVAADKLPHA